MKFLPPKASVTQCGQVVSIFCRTIEEADSLFEALQMMDAGLLDGMQVERAPTTEATVPEEEK